VKRQPIAHFQKSIPPSASSETSTATSKCNLVSMALAIVSLRASRQDLNARVISGTTLTSSVNLFLVTHIRRRRKSQHDCATLVSGVDVKNIFVHYLSTFYCIYIHNTSKCSYCLDINEHLKISLHVGGIM